MTVNLCTVSGTLVAPDGSLMPGVEVRFLPAPVNLRGQDGTLRAPRPVAAVTDAAAGLSVELAPGVYTLRAREAEGREYPPALVDVPATEGADLAEILLHLPAPQSVYDAAASARTASNAAAEAIAAVAGAGSGGGGEGGGPVAWAEVTGKPATFPPAPHGHALAEIADFPTLAPVATSGAYGDLAGRPVLGTAAAADAATFAPATHGHVPAEVTGLQEALDAKAAAVPFTDTQAGLVPAPGIGAPERFLRADGQFAGLLDGGAIAAVYPSRAAFQAAQVPAALQSWSVRHADRVLRYVRDAAGTAIESANGVKGSPADEAWIEHWGGVGDGVTDDAAAIQAAIDWLAGRGGGDLHVSRRIWAVGTTVTLPAFVRLVGRGWAFRNTYTNNALEMEGSVIHLLPGSNCDVIRVIGSATANFPRHDGGMRDIAVHGNRSGLHNPTNTDRNSTGHGIRLDAVLLFPMENVIVTRAAENGFHCANFDFGDGAGARTCNSLHWNRVQATQNGGHGFRFLGGDGSFTQLVAGYNGGDGINGSMGPVSASLMWDNFGRGATMIDGTAPGSLVNCQIYDNRRSGVRIGGASKRIVGCGIWDNGAAEEGTTDERAGIFLQSNTRGAMVTGNIVEWRNRETQLFGIRGSHPDITGLFEPNFIDPQHPTPWSAHSGFQVQGHAPSPNALEIHPGFTSRGSINLDGFQLRRARAITLNGWATRTSISSGTLPLGQDALVAVNVGGSPSVTDLTGTTTNGPPLVIVRNINASPLTFVHDTAKIRLAGGVDRVLSQNEAIMFVHVSDNVWQQVG